MDDDLLETLRNYQPSGMPHPELLKELKFTVAVVKEEEVFNPLVKEEITKANLSSLESFLENLFATKTPPEDPTHEKINQLRAAGCIAVISIGLMMRFSKIRSATLLTIEALIKVASTLKEKFLPILQGDEKVLQTVQQSKATVQFKEEAEHAFRPKCGLEYYRMGELLYWKYHEPLKRPRNMRYEMLLRKAVPGSITAFLPLQPGFVDGLISCVVEYNENHIEKLFGQVPGSMIATRFKLPAIKAQIASLYGDDVIFAIQASQTWVRENFTDVTTSCLTGEILPWGRALLGLTLTVDYATCSSLINDYGFQS